MTGSGGEGVRAETGEMTNWGIFLSKQVTSTAQKLLQYNSFIKGNFRKFVERAFSLAVTDTHGSLQEVWVQVLPVYPDSS